MTDTVVVLAPPETVVVTVNTSTVINVEDGAATPVLVGQPVVTVVEVGLPGAGTPGPPGPPGVSLGLEFTKTVPAATWILAIPPEFTRRPVVTIYDPSGEQVEADIFVAPDHVTVTFPTPFAGTAVLN